MSCASGIYTVFTGSQAIPVGGVIPTGTTVRRYGKNLGQAGDGILLDGVGYYLIDAEVVLTGTTAGLVSLVLTEDGTPIQGGTSTQTVAVDSIYTIPVHAIVRKKCCDAPTTIQLKLSNATGAVPSTINQVSTTIVKI